MEESSYITDNRLLTPENLSGNRLIAAIVGLFVAVGFLVYGLSLGNDFVAFDDSLLIFDNLSVLRAGSWFAVEWAFTHYDPELYIPLTFLSFQLDAIIGGLHPFIFHLDNLLQHITNALLLTWILNIMFKRLDVAVVLGLLFLVHPLNVEAVAWASGRKDLLSSLFFFATIVGYLQYREQPTAKRHWMCIGLFVLGLMAKVSVAPLPLVLLLLDWYLDGYIAWSDIRSKVWYFVAAIPFGLLALLGKDVVLERSMPASIVLLVPKSILFYLQKIVAPIRLSVFYPVDEASVTLASIGMLLPLILVLSAAVFLWKKRKVVPAWSFGASVLFLLLIPSFFQYYRGNELYLASDRYMYMPFLGVLVALASVLVRLSTARLKQVYSGLVLLIAVFGLLSINRSLDWKNTYTLFADTLQYHESFLAYEKVGAELLKRGDFDGAVEALKRSIELSPNSAAYFRLGVAAMEVGNTADAKLFTEEALKLSPENEQALINMSKFLWEEGNRAEAVQYAERAVESHGWNTMGLGNLATMYTLTGQDTKAIEIINRMIEIDPDNERVQPLLERLGR